MSDGSAKRIELELHPSRPVRREPILSAGDLGKRTLPRVTGTSALPWAGAVAAGTSAAIALAPRST